MGKEEIQESMENVMKKLKKEGLSGVMVAFRKDGPEAGLHFVAESPVEFQHFPTPNLGSIYILLEQMQRLTPEETETLMDISTRLMGEVIIERGGKEELDRILADPFAQIN